MLYISLLHLFFTYDTSQILDERITATKVVSTRQFSTQDPQKYIVINSHGLDRPGIVADITQIVTDKGGNVGESQAQLLGGHFAIMMLVQIQSSDVDSLSQQLQENVKGMSTSVFDAISPKKAKMSPKIGCEYLLGISCHLFESPSDKQYHSLPCLNLNSLLI